MVPLLLTGLFKRVMPPSDDSAEIVGRWDERPPLHRTDAYIHAFEAETWHADLRLANYPFGHHVAMMLLLKGRIES